MIKVIYVGNCNDATDATDTLHNYTTCIPIKCIGDYYADAYLNNVFQDICGEIYTPRFTMPEIGYCIKEQIRTKQYYPKVIFKRKQIRCNRKGIGLRIKSWNARV